MSQEMNVKNQKQNDRIVFLTNKIKALLGCHKNMDGSFQFELSQTDSAESALSTENSGVSKHWILINLMLNHLHCNW